MKRIVLVSGWAMPAEILNPLAEALKAQDCVVEVLALSDASGSQWPDLLQMLARSLPKDPVVLVGWSLGGDLCMRFAEHNPQRVSAVVTLASTPSFVARDNWPAAMPEPVFQDFYQGVKAAPVAALKGFAGLCGKGSNNARTLIRTLRIAADTAQTTDTNWSALLDRLAEDAGKHWQKVTVPVHHIFAEQDALVPVAAANLLAQHYPAHKVTVLPGSHVVFLDQTATVADIILSMELDQS